MNSSPSHDATQQRPGGRTARTRRAVLEAAAELLSTSSPADVTVAQIADRAGVNATTIYRKWGTKDALYTDVLLTLSAEQIGPVDTGSLRDDLIYVIGRVAEFLRTPAGFSLAYLGATGEDSTISALRDAFWADRFTKARAIFDRAVERGELADNRQADLAYEMLIGTMHFRLIARRGTLDEDIAERLVGLVLEGVLPRNSMSGSSLS